METLRTVRVDPKTLDSAVAQAPLEELGKVSIQKIESQVSVWRKPKAKTHGAGTAAHNRRLKKEAVLMEIAQSLGGEFTARQVWEAYCKSRSFDGKCHISSVQIFLKNQSNMGELLLTQRWEKVRGKHCLVNYYQAKEK